MTLKQTESTEPGVTWQGRTLLMSGGSRGIGLAIALEAAKRGANVALLAKTSDPHPKLEGTVHSAAAQIEAAGGRALAVVGDVRNDDDVSRAVAECADAFGGIDVVVNNASAIDLSPTDAVDMRRYDLMQDVNVRGSFLLSKMALPHLRASAKAGRSPHILTLSPPIASGPGGTLDPRWAGAHLAYTMAKYGMSMTTLGLAEELRADSVAVDSLWPATLIDTAAIRAMPGGDQLVKVARSPQIVADAAMVLLSQRFEAGTGRFLTDEHVLRDAGVKDFSGYSLGAPEADLVPDIFL